MKADFRRAASGTDGSISVVADDLAYLRTAIVNVFFYGLPGAGDRSWVLIDTGLYGYGNAIREAAEQRFGRGSRPAAIVLTHGHFDHVGTVRELAEAWDAPVYAHELELPYLTGRSPYPPPDPTVGGGAMAALSWLYPRGPIDLGNRVQPLPVDTSVPGMPGWRWIHAPGHTAGHVSLFRDADRTLIAGDAFVTTDQESALAVLSQRPEVQGPPRITRPTGSRHTDPWRCSPRWSRRSLRPDTACHSAGQKCFAPCRVSSGIINVSCPSTAGTYTSQPLRTRAEWFPSHLRG